MSKKGLSAEQTGFFASGKIDIGFEVKDGYVYGVCLLYPSRADQEHEYMIREKSIVAIGDRDLSACVEDAKDFAYKSAISRLESAGNPVFTEQPVIKAVPVPDAVQTDNEKTDAPAINNAGAEQARQSVPPMKMHEPSENETPVPERQELDDEPDLEDDGVQGEDEDNGDVTDFEDDGEDDGNGNGEDEDEPEQANGIQRLDLNFGLQPASNLLNNTPAASAPVPVDSVNSDMKKALTMPITILGKLHSSFGKTAGEILENDPQCIVDFAHRYTGPKVEEKEALVKLYPEALRRVQNAA